MKFYSDFAGRRIGQVALDLVAVTVIVLSILAGVAVRCAILALAAVGAQVEKAGTGLQSTMSDAARAVSGIPLVGAGVRAPFDNASGAGKTLADAGQSGQDLVAAAATIIGIVVAVIPLYFVVRYLLVRRIQFAVAATRATRVARAPGGFELLAFRALATADPREVLALDRDVVGRWRAGDAQLERRLAGLELRRAGVRIGSPTAG